MSQNSLQHILDDIYAWAPELRDQEAKIIPLLEKMRAHAPRIEMDPAFRKKLYQELLQQFRKNPIEKRTWFVPSWWYGFWSACVLGCIFSLIIFPVWLRHVNEKTIIDKEPYLKQDSPSQEVSTLSDRAMPYASNTVTLQGQEMDAKIAPFVEYVYSGALPAIPEDFTPYKQWSRKYVGIGAYPIVEEYGDNYQPSGLDTDHLIAIELKARTEQEIRQYLRTAGWISGDPLPDQSIRTIVVGTPRFFYQRVVRYDEKGVAVYYIPTLLFSVDEEEGAGGLERIVVPLFVLPDPIIPWL